MYDHVQNKLYDKKQAQNEIQITIWAFFPIRTNIFNNGVLFGIFMTFYKKIWMLRNEPWLTLYQLAWITKIYNLFLYWTFQFNFAVLGIWV